MSDLAIDADCHIKVWPLPNAGDVDELPRSVVCGNCREPFSAANKPALAIAKRMLKTGEEFIGLICAECAEESDAFALAAAAGEGEGVVVVDWDEEADA